MRRSGFWTLLAAALLLPASAQAANPDPKWFSYDRPANTDTLDLTPMVPMRDGKQLACSLYTPNTADGKPLNTIVAAPGLKPAK